MSRVVVGVGTSHSPQLSTPPDEWGQRVTADRANTRLAFRGQLYDFTSLVEARAPGFADAVGVEHWHARHAQCRTAVRALADVCRRHAPDLLVVVGNDQRELFLDDLTPAVTVCCAPEIPNLPATAEERARMGPGLAIAEEGHCPPGGAIYRGASELGRHLVHGLTTRGFDVAQSARLPRDGNPQHGIPHAFGFVYRQLFADAPPPSVPLILNANVPFNSPTAARCLALGAALRGALDEWPGNQRIGLAASGGLTHFVIDEALDRRVLAAMLDDDLETLAQVPESHLQAGTGEIKNWLVVVGAMHAGGERMRLLDYVPCYRSEAGTGTAMAFAVWE